MYIYICIYTYTYVYMCVHIYMYIHISILVHVGEEDKKSGGRGGGRGRRDWSLLISQTFAIQGVCAPACTNIRVYSCTLIPSTHFLPRS